MKRTINWKQALQVLALLCSGTAAAQGFTAADPYIYIGRAGMNSATEPTIIYTSATTGATGFTNPTAVTGAVPAINAIGLNPLDHMLYGLAFPNAAATTTAGLFRVAADGSTAQMASIPAPPGMIGMINTTAGTVDAAGNYWFTAYSLTGYAPTMSNLKVYMGRVSAVKDLPGGSTNAAVDYYLMDISDPGVQAGFAAFVSAVDPANPGAANGGMEDIALNPLDGRFYSYLTYPDPANTGMLIGRPVAIDMQARTIAAVGTTLNSAAGNGAPNREIAGNYFDPAGHMTVLFTDGQMAQVDLTTGGLINMVQSNLPLSNGNLRGDLASFTTVVPLPVQLISFRATQITDGVLLNWKMAETGKLVSVAVERSRDAQTFAAIARITDGQSGYTDAGAAGRTYYRLKLNNQDGTAQYSATLAVGDNQPFAATASAFPNPVGDVLTIETAAPAVRVLMTNSAGQAVINQLYAGNDAHIVRVAMPAGLATGNYILSLTDVSSGKLLLNKLVSHP